MTSPSPSPHSSHDRCRNINLLPIGYVFRPRLRDRLTLRRLTLRRKPWAFGVRGFFTRINATHVSIRTSDTSSNPYESPSQAYGTLLYHVQDPKTSHIRSFGIQLEPR